MYTSSHYFVVSLNGERAQANMYCGGSQFEVTDKGVARRQMLRIRKFPGGDLEI